MPRFHTTFLRQPRLLAALLATIACLASPAWAGMENPADTPTIHAVRMDMALVKRLAAAQRAVGDIEDAPPLYMRTKPNHVPKTLDELVAELRTCPRCEAAVKAQGFTPGEYLAASLAFGDAMLGYQFRMSGNAEFIKDQNISETHMAFVKAHYAELTATSDQ